MNITLVVPRLGWGGAVRSTLDLSTALAASKPSRYKFTLVVVGDHTPELQAQVDALGIPLILRAQSAQAQRAIRDADLVHVQFWNTAEMYAWLRAPQPPMRLVMTTHIAGDYPSQMVTQPLLDFADWIVPTSRYSSDLPVFQTQNTARVRVIRSGTYMPAHPVAAPPHQGLRLGYAGTVDFAKMHPRFVALCAAINQPSAIFPVAGGGGGFTELESHARSLGIEKRFEWLGYRTDILNVLASYDVLGYPLAYKSYGTADLILQQAMWLGVPPVILGHGAIPLLLQNGETGIIARDEIAYPEAVNALCENPSERNRISQNARAYAHLHFGAEKCALQLSAVYDAAMMLPKHERVWSGAPLDERFPGASSLIESFGSSPEPYLTSLQSTDPEYGLRAEYAIAHALPAHVSAGSGGILDYRRAFPNDALLRLWAGLVLGKQLRYALAAGEFHAAERLGLDNPRVKTYLKRMINHQPLFEQALP